MHSGDRSCSSVIGRKSLHGAIVAATVGAIVAATSACSVYTRRLSVAAIVAAIVAATIAATIAPTGCGDDRPVYTPYYCSNPDSLQVAPETSSVG